MPLFSSFTGSFAGGRRATAFSQGGATDPDFANVSLLINAENGIVDESNNNHTLTVNGDPTVSTSIVKYGSSSIAFDGVGDYLNITGQPVALDLSTGDFTIEFWVYFNAFVDNSKFYIDHLNVSNYFQFRYRTTTGADLTYNAGSGATIVASQGNTTGWSTGQWYHVALVRNGTNFQIYRDGISIASGTSSVNLGNYSTKSIGGSPYGSTVQNAYFDDFRITKGVARYTTAFTPPTAEFPSS